MLTSCTNEVKTFTDALKESFDTNNAEQLATLYPDINKIGADLSGCTLNLPEQLPELNGDQFSFDATVTRNGEDQKVTFNVAKNAESQLAITGSNGLIAFCTSNEWLDFATKVGAVDTSADDIEVVEFINNEDNINDLKGVQESLQNKIFTIGKIKKASEHIEDGGFAMAWSCTTIYKVPVTNNTNYTFSNAKMNVRYTGHYTDESYSFNKQEKAGTLSPGENSVTIQVDRTWYDLADTPKPLGIVGISQEELTKALESYSFQGNEYTEYMNSKK